jgi:hypothetical protein
VPWQLLQRLTKADDRVVRVNLRPSHIFSSTVSGAHDPGLTPTRGPGLAQQRWTVNGLGYHSEVFSEELQSWVKVSKEVAWPSGPVEVTGFTDSGERVTLRMNPGETLLVR